ncbi:G-type lectin S-receptor-like serine threonine-kinase At4g27290 isoform X1 [Olea europaea subsp. europaea]|uniref:Receptor-like serine/threonine-protein kinase n=1 Tax=Olea europaea subsp. europaea TaxID=158383 RepID=A0A8S0V8W0_OLEEU|nr:G-type lectin S-receptor-like serine threonine-kinase At4g27290 isoform X1 [Olea europaea subsp. europaea]
MKISNKDFPFLFAFTFIISIHKISNAVDTIATSQILRDGETIVSSDGTFELGFFSLGNSKNRYVGMWYKKITVMTVVWVANREVPLTNRSGLLKVVKPGLLVLQNDTNGVIIWSSNTSRPVKTPVAKLLYSGNLVVKETNDDDPENFLWESFNYPTDTTLAGMKLGWNFRTGHEVYVSSWKSNDDPSKGDFTYHFDPTGYPQHVVKKRSVVQFKTGPWNGLGYSGMPNSRKNSIYNYGVVLNKNEAYFSFELLNRSIISKVTLTASGVAQRSTWINRTQGWVIYVTAPTDNCDFYGLCGAYGSCNIAKTPVCGCFDKFLPKDPDGWSNGDWSNGCVRRTPLNCQNGDIFLKYSGIKLPDTQYSWFNESMTIKECKVKCLKNCSCTAYTYLDISRGRSGCLLWFKDLINIKELSEKGEDMYIRMASSELDLEGKKRKVLEVGLSLSIGMVLLGLSLMLYLRRRKIRNHRLRTGRRLEDKFIDRKNDASQNEDIELPLFDLYTIIKATDNFSINNKLGEGGFGPVYKGQEIAVKRLSRNSLQGLDEFKNEVICIAKLQHRNLVKLRGCCIQREEKMLIYEFLPNGSLDFILFDPMRCAVLDWPKRFHIINGIARGLLYLHQDSCLRIIHRDLKASNILLDSDMNPKISDFGMARSFGGNETGANTSRVVGTYGYMSPKYAIDGMFSVKSDVFSFGVLVLEIVSSKRNRGFSHRDHHHSLLGNVSYLSEVLRSVHVGLLCIQQCPEHRPSMSSVVFMLENEVELPQAKQPGFFIERDLFAVESSRGSINQITITQMEAR